MAALRRELDRILKVGHITDSDVTSITGDIRVSPGADYTDGGKAAIDEYRDIKMSYLLEINLLDAIRKAHEKQNAEESTK